jgi:hypothetical protein
MNMLGDAGENWGTGVPQVFRSQNSAAGDNPPSPHHAKEMEDVPDSLGDERT